MPKYKKGKLRNLEGNFRSLLRDISKVIIDYYGPLSPDTEALKSKFEITANQIMEGIGRVDTSPFTDDVVFNLKDKQLTKKNLKDIERRFDRFMYGKV